MKDKLVSLVTFGAIGLLIAAAVFNVKPVGPWIRHWFYRAKGAAVPASAPAKPRGDLGAAQACRGNLQRIESAKAAIRAKGHVRSTGGMSWTEIDKELKLNGRQLVCPAGGEYLLGSMTQACRCSIGGNASAGPEDDHLIKSY